MGFIDLAATPLVSPTVLGIVASYVLLKQGLNAATRPRATKAQTFRYFLVALVTVAFMVAITASLSSLPAMSGRCQPWPIPGPSHTR